ncbi:hypothetical protein V1514DRAFT_335839 [Lipomyces japonicus]|uniref:uncharacterized protein n=1 Tax=Lipomyces japonicus TaxID=56871 RepID=UPI0034CFB837
MYSSVLTAGRQMALRSALLTSSTTNHLVVARYSNAAAAAGAAGAATTTRKPKKEQDPELSAVFDQLVTELRRRTTNQNKKKVVLTEKHEVTHEEFLVESLRQRSKALNKEPVVRQKRNPAQLKEHYNELTRSRALPPTTQQITQLINAIQLPRHVREFKDEIDRLVKRNLYKLEPWQVGKLVRVLSDRGLKSQLGALLDARAETGIVFTLLPRKEVLREFVRQANNSNWSLTKISKLDTVLQRIRHRPSAALPPSFLAIAIGVLRLFKQNTNLKVPDPKLQELYSIKLEEYTIALVDKWRSFPFVEITEQQASSDREFVEDFKRHLKDYGFAVEGLRAAEHDLVDQDLKKFATIAADALQAYLDKNKQFV